jgi:hypothetical protein
MQYIEVRGKSYEEKKWNRGQKETKNYTLEAVFLDSIIVGIRTVVMVVE